MYERILDKSKEPSFEEMLVYCGDSSALWLEVEKFLCGSYDLVKEVRFPYGKDYGWGVNYKHKNKHICDIHAEAGAFTVFFQIRAEAIEKISEQLSDYALKVWDNRYPCGSGGWMRYRVIKKEQLEDIMKLLTAKVKTKTDKNKSF